MSDISKPAWDRLEALVAANWTDITIQYRASAGAWINWRDQLLVAQLSPPWAAIQVLQETPDTRWGGKNKCYLIAYSLFYIRSTSLSTAEKNAGATHAEDLIIPKIAVMRDAILANTTSFQTIEELVTDVGETNPVNQVFRDNADPFWSGMVSGQMLVGETYT